MDVVYVSWVIGKIPSNQCRLSIDVSYVFRESYVATRCGAAQSEKACKAHPIDVLCRPRVNVCVIYARRTPLFSSSVLDSLRVASQRSIHSSCSIAASKCSLSARKNPVFAFHF